MGSLGLLLSASIIIFFKGNRIEVADGANLSIKLDGENLVIQSITPATNCLEREYRPWEDLRFQC